ncbi:MAG: YihY family inner membrane protein [Burkholderiales bacterium]
MNLSSVLTDLRQLTGRQTWRTLRSRFREDRLGVTAGSLTFTTTLALVPFFTLMLAVFTAFPVFAKLQAGLQVWLVDSLVPENIARQVVGYMTQFASKANKLGAAGFAIVLVTALALMLTMDRTLNAIWRVKKPRPLAQRVLVYWAAMTLGPLLLAASLATTSYVISASRGVVGSLPGGVKWLLDAVEFALLVLGMTALYRYVPNTYVKWSHAAAGGVFVAVAMAITQKGLALYLGKVPAYSAIYGAFATVPILLVWIYLAWVIVLLGAVIAAYLPSLLQGVERHEDGPGWRFQLALEAMQRLQQARSSPAKGLSLAQLALALRVDTLQLEPVVSVLCELDWLGRIDEQQADGQARLVLLVEPASTPLQPLMQALLLAPGHALDGLWQHDGLRRLVLQDAWQVVAAQAAVEAAAQAAGPTVEAAIESRLAPAPEPADQPPAQQALRQPARAA